MFPISGVLENIYKQKTLTMACAKIWTSCFVSAMLCVHAVLGVHISNLNESCLRCLCHVAGCDLSHGCTDGYCGPFYISRVYWVDAGKPILPDDSPNRKEAYEDCARDYYCSVSTVEGYMAQFGKDCNGDGVTDCFDYMMINHHGGRACSAPLFLSTLGLQRLKLYKQCRL